MYRINNEHSITRLEDGAVIPRDPANMDFARFLEWEADGGVIEPAPLPAFNAAAAMDRMRVYRSPILDALAGLITDTDNPDDISALRTARQGMKDIPQWLAALPTEQQPTTDEAFDALCVYRYKQLASALPVHLQSAFKGAA
jgi:hypothetical protein